MVTSRKFTWTHVDPVAVTSYVRRVMEFHEVWVHTVRDVMSRHVPSTWNCVTLRHLRDAVVPGNFSLAIVNFELNRTSNHVVITSRKLTWTPVDSVAATSGVRCGRVMEFHVRRAWSLSLHGTCTPLSRHGTQSHERFTWNCVLLRDVREAILSRNFQLGDHEF